ARQAELDRGGRCQPDRPGLGSATLEIPLALEDLEMVVNGRSRGETDRPGDLADRRRYAARPQRRRDEVEDLDLAVGIVLGHQAITLPNGRSIVNPAPATVPPRRRRLVDCAVPSEPAAIEPA